MKSLSELTGKNRHPDWNDLYQRVNETKLPWYLESLDPDISGWIDRQPQRNGDALDVGCGTGEQSMALARLGFRVTGIDISPAAIEAAREASRRNSGTAVFVAGDILNIRLSRRFDLVVDRGCFHVLPPQQHRDFVAAVSRMLRPSGTLLLKAFSTLEPEREIGPLRFDQSGIAKIFADEFELIDCIHSEFGGPQSYRPKAIFCHLRTHRKEKSTYDERTSQCVMAWRFCRSRPSFLFRR